MNPLDAYPEGSRVEAVVSRVEPFGIFVEVRGKVKVGGFIRPRDWSWSRRLFDIGAQVTAGQEIEAQVIGFQRGRLELSRRLALPDPYPAFRRRHPVGDVVLGQVALIAQNDTGVILELDDGVEGFVPRAEIPDTREEGFGLLARDWVAARILQFTSDQVRLSIRDFLRARAADAPPGDESSTALRFHPSVGPGLESLRLDLELGELNEPEIDPAVREKVRRVLVVEDSENVSESLAMLFEYFGFTCDRTASVEEGLERLDAAPYDLLILDVNLPASHGGELLRRLRSERAAYVFVLSATTATDWRELVETANHRVTCFFQKPTRATRLFEQLGRLVRGETPEDDRELEAGLEASLRSSIGDRVEAVPGRRSGREKIVRYLDDLRRETGADRVCVLAYEPGPRFELIAGELVGMSREVQQELDISPVGDVFRRRRFLHVADVASQRERFKHLLEVVPVGSFAGLPLAYADRSEYALFLLAEHAHQLRAVHEDRLRATSLAIGQAIAEERFNEVVTQNQALLLTGFLSDSLLHEVKNELQALDDYAAVQLLIGKSATEGTGLAALGERRTVDLKRTIVGIQAISERLGELVALFRNLAGRPPEERVDLNRTIERLRETVKPFAEGANVILELELDPRLPTLEVSPKHLEQPLLNLMINAVEQLAPEPRARKWVRVRTEYDEGAERPVVVRVEDNGPGIHFVHRHKIFDLFFTTKQRGTGLGLYISRFFIEQLGGRLELAKSIRFAGTELRIELPERG